MKSYIKSILFSYLLHIATVSVRARSSGLGGGLQSSNTWDVSHNGLNFGSGGVGSFLSDIMGGNSAGLGRGGTNGEEGVHRTGNGQKQESQSFSVSLLLGNIANSISSLGDNMEKAIGKAVSIMAGGNNNLSGSGKSGYSVESSVNIDIPSFLTEVLEAPIKLVRTMVRLVVNLSWNLITLQFKALKIPFSIINRVVSITRTVVAAVISRLLNAVLKINSLNAEIVSGAIGAVESTVGYIISTLADVLISGIQTTSNIIGFSGDRLMTITKTAFKTGINLSTNLKNSVEDGVKFLNLDKIPNLPGIRNIISIISDGVNYGSSVVSKQFNKLLQFINKIIYENQDFFIPLFKQMDNIFLAVRDAINRIVDGGQYTEIGEMFGKMQNLLSPLMNRNWPFIGGFNGTMKNICSMVQDECTKYADYSEVGDDCSGGPLEESGSDFDGETFNSNERSSSTLLDGGNNGGVEFGGDEISTANNG
ncbi:uncharacterized protein LOC130450903 isoform X1 [Diorhabda sublineata]|uniref:uncharacterized protein LOC130450903 isoform X1 n=1 Tax=Diorhabda sublineata TaxID=1163346 RepID=UPI0024E0725E|nr:uncharacterized protein LOC130450903 isoform X1 [Diorhabda sublineata]